MGRPVSRGEVTLSAPAGRLWRRSFGNLAGGQVVTDVVRLVSFVWIARRLGPSAFGTVTIGLVVGEYLSVVAHSGYDISGARDMARHPDAAAPMIGEVVGVRLVLATAFAAAAAVVILALPVDPKTRPVALAACLLCFTRAVDLRWAFVAAHRGGVVAVASVTAACAYLTGILLTIHTHDDYARVPLFYVGAEAVAAAVMVAVSLRSFGVWWPRAPRQARRADLLSTSVITFTRTARTFMISLDLILVRVLRPPIQAGQYAAASRLAGVGLLYVGLYYHSLLPSLVHAAATGTEQLARLVRTLARRAALLTVPGALVATVAVGPVVRTLFGPRYAATVGLLQVLVWSLAVLAVGSAYTWALLAIHEQRRLALIMVVALTVNIVLNLALLPTIGTVGASVATGAAEATSLALAWRTLSSVLRAKEAAAEPDLPRP